MIDVKELRIGNLFDNHGTTCFVMSILRGNRAEFGYFKDSIGFERYLMANNCPKSIPLTEEWLLKFGFEKIKNNGIDYELHDCVISVNAKWMWTAESKLNEVRTLIPTHVHTLQNLYFALTGEELTIKE